MEQHGAHLSYVLITPARNEEPFIVKIIRSTIQQTVLPMKWVTVNDGSTDGTEDVVKRYLPEHSWIEMVEVPLIQGSILSTAREILSITFTRASS